MVDLIGMDKVLRTVYLDVVSTYLNEKTSAFYKAVNKSSANVYGKEIIFPSRYGINGGVACGTETGDLPVAGSQNVIQFKAPLCNVYGTLEMSDKLLRVSDGGGSIVDALNFQIDSLLASARFNMRRMLFQAGDGVLATTNTAGNGTPIVGVDTNKNLAEGMIVDFVYNNQVVLSGYRIVSMNRTLGSVKFDQDVPGTVSGGAKLVLQGSFKAEIYGIPYLFSNSGSNAIYGNTRSLVPYALPIENTTDAVTPIAIQAMIDAMEEAGAEQPNMIIGSYEMRRRFINAMNTAQLNIETVQFDEDYKAIGYNGVPIFAERFAPENAMYFLNTDDFALAQLGDWTWVEGSTHDILRPIYGKAAYTATLVKYCNLICRRPASQAMLTYSQQ